MIALVLKLVLWAIQTSFQSMRFLVLLPFRVMWFFNITIPMTLINCVFKILFPTPHNVALPHPRASFEHKNDFPDDEVAERPHKSRAEEEFKPEDEPLCVATEPQQHQLVKEAKEEEDDGDQEDDLMSQTSEKPIVVNDELLDLDWFRDEIAAGQETQGLLFSFHKGLAQSQVNDINECLFQCKVPYHTLKFDPDFSCGDLAGVLVGRCISSDAEITYVDLRRQKLQKLGFEELSRGFSHSEGLQKLVLAENPFPSPGSANPLAGLANCSTLVELDLSYCSLTDDCLAACMGNNNFSKLKILNLEGNVLTGSCFRTAVVVLDLEEIDLSHNAIQAANLTTIFGTFYLAHSLFLNGNIQLFTDMEVLERLANSDGLDAWKVRLLSVADSGLTEDTLPPLVKTLTQLEELKVVDLSMNSLQSDKAVDSLCRLFQSPSLSFISAKQCSLSSSNIETISKVFHSTTREDKLTIDISDNTDQKLILSSK
eukprot:TRINITY_DN25575_c0_g1_i1.p1 TRINITY_DN25575_c0_g1~~TRINITY_DN25575_c0_g1_i1.p1  ORF type:complete len:484 (-),score=120.21 TRINITY_DN25575_c0_g1_i1:26-1477(-)